jgi:hypothetical protein
MRRVLLLLVLASGGLANTGCLLNIYSSEPNVRIEQLLNNSEDLRQIGYEWRRIWFTDQPSHLTPERVHGGIQ